MVDSPSSATVVEGLLDALRRGGADALNLRIHVPGLSPGDARDQITRLGDDVLGPLRNEMCTMGLT
jgi:hypothetical protein